jgi:hypothetical protein
MSRPAAAVRAKMFNRGMRPAKSSTQLRKAKTWCALKIDLTPLMLMSNIWGSDQI